MFNKTNEEIQALNAKYQNLLQLFNHLSEEVSQLRSTLEDVKSNLDETATASQIMDEWINGKDGNE